MHENGKSPNAHTPSRVTSLRQLNSRLRRLVEEQTRDEHVRVRGMAWNVRRSSTTGQVRFLLRHNRYSLPCVIFRDLTERLPFPIEDRQQLIVEGRVEVYAVWGELQIVVRMVELDKIVEEQQTLTALKARAEAEGWLDRERKPLPRPPQTIGLIAGTGSKARGDVKGSLRDAGIESPVIEEAANMEGPDAAKEICSALAVLNENPEVNLIVITRGGANMSVLWAFNDWKLNESIVQSRVPVLTAIGHRQDETLADLVADMRVHTPSLVGAALAQDRPKVRDEMLADEIADARPHTPSLADTTLPKDRPKERGWTLVVVLAVILIIVLIAVAQSRGWL